jgi:hypothetical protein
MIGPEDVVPGPIRLARAESMNGTVALIESWELARDEPPPANWFWTETNDASTFDGAVPLVKVARVRRGTATGANFFFFLSDDQRTAFPNEVMTPAVASLRRFEGTVLDEREHRTWGRDDEPRWLLVLDPDAPIPDAVAEYVAEHEKTVSRRHLSTQRKRWWAITELPRPDIFISPLSQSSFKIVLNKARAVGSNNLLGLTVIEGDPEPLADWLRSDEGQSELRRVSRRYSGGSFKVEPGGLKRMRIPARVAELVAGKPPDALGPSTLPF